MKAQKPASRQQQIEESKRPAEGSQVRQRSATSRDASKVHPAGHMSKSKSTPVKPTTATPTPSGQAEKWGLFPRRSTQAAAQLVSLAEELQPKKEEKKGSQASALRHTLDSQTSAKLIRRQTVEEVRGNRAIKITKTKDPSAYRQQLYKAFETCQRDYIKRLEARGRDTPISENNKLRAHLTSGAPPEKLRTCEPRAPKFSERPHKLVKFGGALRLQKTRYFLIDNENLLYFAKETDRIAKGFKTLSGAKASVQEQEDAKLSRAAKWIEPAQKYRVVIALKGKEGKPLYVYSSDPHFCKALAVKVKTVANPQFVQQLVIHTHKMSKVYRLSQFRSFWSCTRRVYEEKARKIKAFQAFGKKMLDVAGQSWQRNRRLLKRTNEMVESVVSVDGLRSGKLMSTFKTGKVKHSIRRSFAVNISLSLLHRLQALTHMIRSRRIFRSKEISNEITEDLRREIYGTAASFLTLQGFDVEGVAIPNQLFKLEDGNARVSFEPHSTDVMLIEHCDPEKCGQASFFTQKFLKRIDLNQISMIATDLQSFFQQGVPREDEEPEFNVQIYGRCSQPYLERADDGSEAVEFSGLAPLRKSPQNSKTLEVKVTKVEFPVEFIRRHNKKGFVRVKLIQGMSLSDAHSANDENFRMDPHRQFSSISEDFRLNVVDFDKVAASLRPGALISVTLPAPVIFTIRPLLQPEKEQFTFQVIFYANLCPVPSVIKDYMVESVYSNKKNKFKMVDNSVIYSLRTENGNEAAVHAQIRPVPSREIDEREGPRILVGRYVLLDNRTQMQVLDYSAENQTFTLRSVRGDGLTKFEIPLNRIKRIERYGVSIYDLNRLPEQVSKSNFEFVCTIRTRNAQFLTTLLSKISDLHVKRTFAKRQQLEQKSRIARGNLVCSVVEATNLGKSMTVRKAPNQVVLPYVKITLEQIRQGQDPVVLSRQTIDTAVIGTDKQHTKGQRQLLKSAVWATAKAPTGSVHDMGQFSKNMGEEATDLGAITDVIEKPKSFAGHGRRSSLVLNLQDARRPMHNILLHDGSVSLDKAEAKELQDLAQPGGNKDALFDISNSAVSPEDVFIRFQVYNSKRGARSRGQEALLGQSLIQVTRLIDLHEPQKVTQLLLLLPGKIVEEELGEDEIMSEDKMFAGTLSIQSLFVPDRDTRWNFDMYESNSDIKDPEAMAHLNQLLQPQTFDSYHYAVPTVAYNPQQFANETYFERFKAQSRPRILVDKATLRQHMQEIHSEYTQAEYLRQDRKYYLMKNMIRMTLRKQMFASHEEVNDFFMWTDDQFRPMKQDYSANFMQRWLALTIQNSYEARKRLNRFLWQQFISGLIKSGAAGVLPTDFDEEDYGAESEEEEKAGPNLNLSAQQQQLASHVRKDTYVTRTVKALLQRSSFKAQNPSNVAAQEDDAVLRDSIRGTQPNLKTQQVIMETLGRGVTQMFNKVGEEGQELLNLKNKELTLFLQRESWEADKTCSEYADLYYLVHAGIPDELRVRLWKELLRTKMIEKEQIANFKNAYKDKYTYNSQDSLYNNYLEMSQSFDCLAFKQIDEDIMKYETIDSYLQDAQTKYERDLILRNEKNSMRNLLRVLILWSKQEKQKGPNGEVKDVVITYGTGFMDMIQRLNAITHSEQECFSILTGIIRSFPRPFSVEKSILVDRCDAMMRYEMTAFKAMVEHSLPEVYAKLKAIGLPIELLTYRQISSFYAAEFHTEIVHRLWDIIIFFFSSTEKEERKRGLWWLLSPAYLILQEKATQICAAVSCEEVIEVYRSGGAMTYDPDWFVEKIKDINQKIFIEGPVKQRNRLAGLFFADEATNVFAQKFEEKRADYQDKLIKLFDQVQQENKSVEGLMGGSDVDSQSMRQQVFAGIDSIAGPAQTQLLRRKTAKNLARRLSNRMFSIEESTFDYSASQMNLLDDQNGYSAVQGATQRDDELIEVLPVGKIMIYIHDFQVPHEYIPIMHCVRVQYGRIDPKTGLFVKRQISGNAVLEEGPDLNNPINLMAEFLYAPGNNFLQFELINQLNGRQILYKIVPLPDLPLSKFTTRRILAQARSGQALPAAAEQSQMHLNVSFYIEHVAPGNNGVSTLHKCLESFNRKKPDLADIFDNKGNLQQMTAAFETLVKNEYRRLKTLLNDGTALDIINEMFNHVVAGDYGKVSENQFKELVAQILPSASDTEEQVDQLEVIFQIYTDTQVTSGTGEAEQGRAEKLLYRKRTLKQQARLHSQVFTPEEAKQMQAARKAGDTPHEFSLRHFFTTCVLMSHATVEEKLSLLYDTFARIGGASVDNSPGTIVELISTIFNRNLYFWPAHELYNQVEQVFTGGIGMVQGAYWTSDFSLLEGWRADVQANAQDSSKREDTKTPQDLFFETFIEQSQNGLMNVTVEVQEAITSYFSVFGTKIIDFNADVSPFRDLKQLVGAEKADSMLKVAQQDSNRFKLVLFCTTESERFSYVLNYENQNGTLVSTGPSREGNPNNATMQTVFERNSNKLFLSGMNRPISKEEFLQKIEKIPFFTNLIRVETFVRDRSPSELVSKQRTLPVHITFFAQETLFIFTFQKRANKVQEGNSVRPDGSSFKFEMNNLSEEDTLADARKRISMALMLAHSADIERAYFKDTSLAMFGDVIGTRDFQVLSTAGQGGSGSTPQQAPPTSAYQWRLLPNDYIRFHHLGASERNNNQWIMLKLESPRESRLLKSLLEKEKPAAFDCLAIYKHADQSFDWLPCKIVSRRLRKELADLQDISLGSQCFDYQVAFLHLALKQDAYTMSRNVFPRNAEEILFSDCYSREIQRNFKQECLDFIRETYRQGPRPSILDSIKEISAVGFNSVETVKQKQQALAQSMRGPKPMDQQNEVANLRQTVGGDSLLLQSDGSVLDQSARHFAKLAQIPDQDASQNMTATMRDPKLFSKGSMDVSNSVTVNQKAPKAILTAASNNQNYASGADRGGQLPDLPDDQDEDIADDDADRAGHGTSSVMATKEIKSRGAARKDPN